MSYDRDIFFDMVRQEPFSGSLTQSQVEGMEAILSTWEQAPYSDDHRWLAYALATTYHETSQEMQPIEEYGKGSGMSYGSPDPTTGQTYYGRGYVQLTWGDNYKKADTELKLVDDFSCYWHAENALDPDIAAEVMFKGMVEGWFRSGETLEKYFNDDTDDPYGAREIINGDKSKVPSWSGGMSIGNFIAGYHDAFFEALDKSWSTAMPAPKPPKPKPMPVPPPATMTITLESEFRINVTIVAGGQVRIVEQPPNLPSEPV